MNLNSKMTDLKDAVSLVKNGDIVSFGGNALYRSPIGVVKEIVRQKKRDLHLVKTAIAYEADLLCAAHCVSDVTAGFVGYEGEYGLCKWYRKGVESGEVKAHENACYSVITAWRAAAYGVPFLPIRGMKGSDLLEHVGFQTVHCPYTKESLVAVAAIAPDIAFLHVQKADIYGNGWINGPVYEDKIIARAAKKLILTCEEIVPTEFFTKDTHLADIPAPLTNGVVLLSRGAAPTAVSGYYEADANEISAFTAAKTADEALRAAGLGE